MKLIDYIKEKLGFTDKVVKISGVIDEHGDFEPVDDNTLAILNEVMRTGNDVEGHVDSRGKLHIKVSKRKKR